MTYRPTIGLEIHAELKTKSKMFCSCLNNPDEKEPNKNICPVCTAQPGSLPVINEEAIKYVIKAGLALNSQIAEFSKFDRKNYFYPDLPKGYQISQYDKPLCEKGFLNIDGRDIWIRRVHLEEDTGSSMHQGDHSLVNLNRAGVPLMELVTEPNIESAQEARKFSQELQLIFRYLGISDADMEKGQMRVEANISVSKDKKLGTKVEIKNLNSFKSVERGIEYEIERQTKMLENGENIIQETRGWDENKQKTISQREKEEAHDYRYFPEPDLPSLHFKKEYISEIKKDVPELPSEKRKRFKKNYALGDSDIEILVQKKDLGDFFENTILELKRWLKEEYLKAIKLCANYMITDLGGLLGNKSVSDKDFQITAENFAEFVSLIYKGDLSSKLAKIVLEEMYKTGTDPSQVVKEKGLKQITNEGELDNIIKEIIGRNPQVVEDFKNGKENSLQFLVGQVMAQTKGKANPQGVIDILKKNLK